MNRLLIIVAIIAVVLVVGGMLVLRFVTGSNAEVEENPILVPLDKEILTNLSNDGNVFHYIKVSVSLEVVNNSAAEIVKAEMPKIRDEIISVFNGTRISDLSTPNGIELVKARLIERLNSLLKAKLVRKILFTDMVLQ